MPVYMRACMGECKGNFNNITTYARDGGQL